MKAKLNFRTATYAKAIVILSVFLLLPVDAWACPNCKNAVAESSNSLTSGFAWSVAALIAAPLLIVAGWAIALRRILRAGLQLKRNSTI